ncbi:MAG: precorrin-3B synthase [Pseudomonadota bacterium]
MTIAPLHPPPPETKGWCPSLLRPMQSGDGLIARLKPTAATFRTSDLRPIVAAAESYGNGHCELTRRGNLQARGFDDNGHAALARVAIEHGLALKHPAAEARRTVLSSPLSLKDDPSCAFDAHSFARDLELAIANADDLAALPAKFGIAVDGGGALPISQSGHAPGADITIAPLDGRPVLVLAGDADHAALITLNRLVADTLSLMSVFVGATGPKIRRMSDWVAREGADTVFARAGLTASTIPWRSTQADPPVGWIQLTGKVGVLVIAAPFGRLLADQLHNLCDLADRYGDGTLRITPWRSVVLPGVSTEQAAAATADCRALGLIIEPDDPRLRIAACAGAPGCQHAHAPAVQDAERLAGNWNGTGLLHVSGCAKGCAHSGTADVTLIAGRDGYDWIEAGSVTDPVSEHGLTVDEVSTRLKETPE